MLDMILWRKEIVIAQRGTNVSGLGLKEEERRTSVHDTIMQIRQHTYASWNSKLLSTMSHRSWNFFREALMSDGGHPQRLSTRTQLA